MLTSQRVHLHYASGTNTLMMAAYFPLEDAIATAVTNLLGLGQ